MVVGGDYWESCGPVGGVIHRCQGEGLARRQADELGTAGLVGGVNGGDQVGDATSGPIPRSRRPGDHDKGDRRECDHGPMSYSLLIFHFLCSFHSLDRVTGTRAFIVSFAWFSGP